MLLQKLVSHSEIVVDVSLVNANPPSQQLGLGGFSSLYKLLSVSEQHHLPSGHHLLPVSH